MKILHEWLKAKEWESSDKSPGVSSTWNATCDDISESLCTYISVPVFILHSPTYSLSCKCKTLESFSLTLVCKRLRMSSPELSVSW